jgi:hypothetical protein
MMTGGNNIAWFNSNPERAVRKRSFRIASLSAVAGRQPAIAELQVRSKQRVRPHVSPHHGALLVDQNCCTSDAVQKVERRWLPINRSAR